MEKTQKYTITEDVLNKIYQYLLSRPYIEVVSIIEAMKKEIKEVENVES